MSHLSCSLSLQLVTYTLNTILTLTVTLAAELDRLNEQIHLVESQVTRNKTRKLTQ